MYLVAEATEKRVAAPTPRRADREGIVISINVKSDEVRSITKNEGLQVRFYKTGHEQTVQVVAEERADGLETIVYQSAPDTRGLRLSCV